MWTRPSDHGGEFRDNFTREHVLEADRFPQMTFVIEAARTAKVAWGLEGDVRSACNSIEELVLHHRQLLAKFFTSG